MDRTVEKSQQELQKIFEELLGSKHVYFQPPENLRMEYPCILYSLTELDRQFADNMPYRNTIAYTVILITRDPLYNIAIELGKLRYSRFDRFYIFDNLNHYVYKVYN